MDGQATGCNGHGHRHWHRHWHWHWHTGPSLVRVVAAQGRAISPQYKDRMTAGDHWWGEGGLWV